jgi:origin recognition complex subunit 4
LIQDVDANEEQTQNTPLPDYAETFCKTCDPHLREEVGILSNLVLEKLTGRRLVPLKGLDAEYQKVYQLVEQTVTAGEGNSMLLMGSRGSGKTAMVESIISTLAKNHKDDFHVVRLNGFLHTDDRLALREIWRQLGRETHTEDEASKINSYADTMATLLALLSHPEELFDGSDMTGIPTAKSVVIVLEEFDLFATHPRQTLLYNLFDIAQARKAPLAVLGLTTKVDVTEALEKRVKSRFSHRYVFLPSARTFEGFSEACLSALDVADEEIQDSELWQLKLGPRSQLIDSWRIFLKVGSAFDIFRIFANWLCRDYGPIKNSRGIYSKSTTKLSLLKTSSLALYYRYQIYIIALMECLTESRHRLKYQFRKALYHTI